MSILSVTVRRDENSKWFFIVTTAGASIRRDGYDTMTAAWYAAQDCLLARGE